MINNRVDAISLAIEVMNICHENGECEKCILHGTDKNYCLMSEAIDAAINRVEGNKEIWDRIYKEYNKASMEQVDKTVESLFVLENNARLRAIEKCISGDFDKGIGPIPANETEQNSQKSFANGKDTAEKPIIYWPKDNVKHPNHYIKGGMECVDVIRAAVTNCHGFEAYCVGNIIKYIWRYKDKNGAEDLAKAMHYLEWLQEEVKK